MRKIILLAVSIIVLHASVGFARCASKAWSVWPEAGEVPRNTNFILEGYGSLQGVVETLNNGVAYLQGGEDSIPLKAIQVFHGQMSVSQVVLLPARLLQANTVYK